MKAMDMKSRIELELRGKDASTIKELNLDSCRAQHLDGLTDDFQSLEILSLINVGLTSLKGFPKLPNLRKLELSDNRISSGLDNLLGCQSLTHLNLSGNKFKDIDSLAALGKLSSLTNLDMFNCDVTQVENYREKVFKLLPSLKYLDGFDQNEQEEDEFEGDNESDDDEDDDDEEEEDEDDDDEDDEDDDEEQEAVGVNGVKANGVNKRSNVNGSNDDEEEDDDEDDDDEEDDENEVGLSYLQKSNLEDDEDDEDFDEQKAMKKAQEEDDDEEEEEEDEDVADEVDENDANVSSSRSRKRKHEETGDEDS